VFLLSEGWAPAADAPTTLPLAVRVEGRRLSVHLDKVPLARVIEIILERSASELTVLGDASGVVSADFDDLPLQEGLLRLLAPRSFVVVYAAEGAEPPAGGRLKVMAVDPDRAAADQTSVSGQAGKRRGSSAARPPADPARPADPELLAAVEAGGRGTTLKDRAKFLEEVVATEPDAATRSMALKMLTVVSPARMESISRAAISDPSPEVRRRALELLVANGQSSQLVVNTLLAVANGDSDESLRAQAKVYATNLDPSLLGGLDPLRVKP
jgi:hypothetical protein